METAELKIPGTVKKEIQFVKTDPELVKKIVEKTGFDEILVKQMMRYNMWTQQQYCDITGVAESTIKSMTTPKVINGELKVKLNICYPFPRHDGKGQKFIFRDELSMIYLTQRLNG